MPMIFSKNLKHDVGVQYPGLCLLEAYSDIKYSRGLLSQQFPKGAERVALQCSSVTSAAGIEPKTQLPIQQLQFMSLTPQTQGQDIRRSGYVADNFLHFSYPKCRNLLCPYYKGIIADRFLHFPYTKCRNTAEV